MTTQMFWSQLSKENLQLVNIKDWPYLMGYIAEALIKTDGGGGNLMGYF